MHTSRTARATVVALFLVLLAAAPVSRPAAASSSVVAEPAAFVRIVRGGVGDPGPVVSNVVLDGTHYTFDFSGGSTWRGTLSGTTSYSGTGVLDPVTLRATMHLTERFTGTLAGIGAGTLTFRDRLVQGVDPDTFEGSGPGHVDCVLVASSGLLRGSIGAIRFSWDDLAADGSAAGSYFGLITRAG